MIDFMYTIISDIDYPEAPFHPPSDYPEFKGMFSQFNKRNKVYEEIRNLFSTSGYDIKNIGSDQWNPLRGYITNGQTVIIKPNFVCHENGNLLGKNVLTTHASILRPVIDYLILLQKQDQITFKIIIADVPIQGADFEQILIQTGLKDLLEFYQQNEIDRIEVLDLRHKIAIVDKSGFFKTNSATGDPLGYSKVHLGKSFLDEIASDFKKFGSPGYGARETYSQIELTGIHYYHIPNSILNADLFINIPKLKTHKKAGITIALKNLIGINGEKAWIPHFRRGAEKNGGDEFDNNQIFLKKITTKSSLYLQGRSKLIWKFGKIINAMFVKPFFRKDLKRKSKITENQPKALFLIDGNWYGNDTVWRPILDLNYLLFFVDKTGKESFSQKRKYICLTDGIIAGEGDGPLSPDPKNAGIIALSGNPVLNDVCFSKIMGFDWGKIPQLKHAVDLDQYFFFSGSTKKIIIGESSSNDGFCEIDFDDLPNLYFTPAPGWIGHVELT
jgi:uncharacterized protein (DUF362 family)